MTVNKSSKEQVVEYVKENKNKIMLVVSTGVMIGAAYLIGKDVGITQTHLTWMSRTLETMTNK